MAFLRWLLVTAGSDNIKGEPEPQYGGYDIPNDAKGGKSKQEGADTCGDHHGGADNHGADDDP